ncbi:hypothetical protein [Novipirellula artificiosorum]|uniref:Uncharacterized protein n=1 Tax=Novipirellula artificiosorum TaxID=2528016 RepID=A0A5C6DEL3_9BACT|nr:hypothetical protein [Novipirellula artificiosorum]TWU34364.1 hypothetical protein Poly41_45110 [Novipirellula artificiosorum]
MMRMAMRMENLRQMVVIGGLFSVLAVATLGSSKASDPSIFKVEEVWEMVVNEPDPANISPQITFFLSPSTDIDDCYFQLQMNYEADDDFSGGGFHVGAIDHGKMIDEARSGTHRVLATKGDHVRWTNVVAVVNNKLLFAVKDGLGAEWGGFGGPEYLVTIPSSPVTDLSAYDPQQSLDAIDIGFGANRIDRVTLVEVRVFYSDGHALTLPINRQP